MPAKSWVVPGSLADQIATVLTDHPGGLRTAELSRLVHPDPLPAAVTRSAATMAVGAECSRLYRTGRLLRTQQSMDGRKVPITRYSLPRD